MEFAELVQRSRREGEPLYQGRLLALDPGHTTGWCLFNNLELIDFGQINTENHDTAIVPLQELLKRVLPVKEVIFEDYRVYGWKAKQHAFSDLHTAKFIGVIQAVCYVHGLHYHKQPANVAKQFATDAHLREWGYWERTTGQRHARDAIRHACHFITFGSRDKWPERASRAKGKTVG